MAKQTSDREAPSQRTIVKSDVVNPLLNDAQLRILMEGTPEYAIKHRPGRGGMTFRYVQHGYVTDQLNKAFGFDWDFRILPVDEGKRFLLTTTEEQFWNNKLQKMVTKPMRNISVYGELTVRIHSPKPPYEVLATIVKPGFGSQNWEATIEFGDALKGAKSDALKVAAHELGIALDLYWDDKAELSAWEDKQRKAEELNGLTQLDCPQNAAQLVARAQSELNLGLARLQVILGVDATAIFTATTEQVELWWTQLTKESK